MKTIIGNKSSGWSYDSENNTIILSEYVSTFEKIFQKKTGVTTLFVDHIERI